MGAFLVQIIGIIAASVVGSIGIYYQFLSNKGLLKRQQVEDERREIYQKLNAFYGPYQQRLAASSGLHEYLSAPKEQSSRLLDILLSRKPQLDENDKELLAQIIKINEELDHLTLTHGGLVDDPELRLLISKASTYFRIISLAYSGRVAGKEHFKGIIFPKELVSKLEEDIISLKKRLDELNRIF